MRERSTNPRRTSKAAVVRQDAASPGKGKAPNHDGVARALADGLAQSLYVELRRIAARLVRRERAAHRPEAAALANEAYLRLREGGLPDGCDERLFLIAAARVMRASLIDDARARRRAKRGGRWRRLPLDGAIDSLLRASHARGRAAETSDALGMALEDLARRHPRPAYAIELRYFGGLTVAEVATALRVSVSTVHEDLAVARAWLHDELVCIVRSPPE